MAEEHRSDAMGWLRASVLGANDGIVSTASLLMGISATAASHRELLVTGVAGLVAGAMAMAAGEYISVSSQADAEKADVARETKELRESPDRELAELVEIYKQRGLTAALALEVATQLTEHNAVDAHLRDELGMTPHGAARPVQAALASAISFAAGAVLPLFAVLLAPRQLAFASVGAFSMVCLAVMGALSARAGGASMAIAVGRVVLWGALAMGFTAAVGALLGVRAG